MAEEKKVPAVNEEITSLTAELKSALKIAKDASNDIAPTIFTDYLTTKGFSEDEIEVAKRVDDALVPFVAAATNAFGEQTPDAFAANPDMERITATVPLLNKNQLRLTAKREAHFNAGLGEDAKQITYYNEVAADISLRASRSSAGQLNAVKHSLRALGAEKIPKK